MGEEPALVCTDWSKWERQGRPELTGAKLGAAAGVRLRGGTGCGARGGHPRGSAAPSWHREHDGVLGLGGGGPRRRRRHGRRREASAVVARRATACGQLNGERGTVAELTAGSTGLMASSGTHWRRRGGDGDPRRLEVKKAAATAPRGVRRGTAWRRGGGQRGGASGLEERARGRWWPRQWRAAATARSGGRVGERPGEGEE